MIVLDASLLIAHLERADVHHTRATELLLAHADDEFASSAVTLAEVLVGAVRAGRGESARDALADLGVRAIGLEADAAWELARLRVLTGLKLPDCCVLYAAQVQAPARVATFDAALATGAAELGVAVLAPPA